MLIPALTEMGFYPSAKWQTPPAFHAALKAAPSAFRQGAILQFEAADALPLGKTSQTSLKQAISVALNGRFRNPWPYTWVLVSKGRPETVTVWAVSDGNMISVLHTRANTGVLHSTPDGSWTVYERLPLTTMQGAFPVPLTAYQQRLYAAGMQDGLSAKGLDITPWHGTMVRWRPYDDHGIKWVNYFDQGRALHYFPRAGYGWPQSAGCVEMPDKAAHQVYNAIHFGTVVTVSNPHAAA
ncbi:ErfK/YbiS/YcfS/YnhG family protein [Acidithiobacillus ferrivorans]|uniref:ErfK/YbiS/YcfS/YnhG family protein n=1 Tax=Acidithiobacillus ferrivorans TaxID=160808 RepID=A0A060UQL3_9PROT|nr:L,D-transpeptidase [Acidithiobacillus ferrivorans]CDQ10546.1 ErfK/YbiS/YcfS/YnhG family protein [Acidithiobacillus ferrivorans]SMH64576.1 ErfK/YbiS/YcfS/YnhG family protein [Acidithiobacillus ferrivorans]